MRKVHRTIRGRLRLGKEEKREILETIEAFKQGLSLIPKTARLGREERKELYHCLHRELGLPAVYANAALRNPSSSGRPKGGLPLYAKAFTLSLDADPPLLSVRTLHGRVTARYHTSPRNLALLREHPPTYGVLVPDGDRLYVHFCVKIPIPSPPREPAHVVGVDVGEWYLLATSDGVVYAADPLREVLEEMAYLEPRLPWSKRAQKRYEKLSHESNSLLRATLNHFVRSLPPGTLIVLEDLRGFKNQAPCAKERRPLFQLWPYGRIRKLITEKAEAQGHRVRLVSPAYTSLTCPACGDVHENNRSGAAFHCRKCGFSGHADLVAALNIRDLGSPWRAMPPGPAHPLAVYWPTTSGVRELPRPAGERVQSSVSKKEGGKQESHPLGGEGGGACGLPELGGQAGHAEEVEEVGEGGAPGAGVVPGDGGEGDAHLGQEAEGGVLEVAEGAGELQAAGDLGELVPQGLGGGVLAHEHGEAGVHLLPGPGGDDPGVAAHQGPEPGKGGLVAEHSLQAREV